MKNKKVVLTARVELAYNRQNAFGNRFAPINASVLSSVRQKKVKIPHTRPVFPRCHTTRKEVPRAAQVALGIPIIPYLYHFVKHFFENFKRGGVTPIFSHRLAFQGRCPSRLELTRQTISKPRHTPRKHATTSEHGQRLPMTRAKSERRIQAI